MKLFLDVIFALLPLALIVVPVTALLILRAVMKRKEQKSPAGQSPIQEKPLDQEHPQGETRDT